MRLEMIENFSVTFSSLKFSFCMAAIISEPTPFKWLCNFALYFSCRKNAVGTTKNFYPYTYPKEKILWATTKIFSHLSKGKTILGYALKIYSLTFSAEKSGVLFPEKLRIYKMFKILRTIRKKKAGKGRWYPLPAAVYIFETETGSCDHVSDYFTFLRF